MMIPVSLSFTIGLGSILLHWQSQKNQGLCSEDVAIFGWKFIPTLITVIYSRFTAILLENVQRTEPWARMARPSSSVPGATFTILEKPRSWWVALTSGLRKNRNGGVRSWVVVLCCTVHILAVLVISPLSAALLGTKVLQITVDLVSMKRIGPIGGPELKFRADRGTFLRTSVAQLQNYSSSPWVTDEYFVLPFWPADLENTQWSPYYSSPQRWSAMTHVFKADFKCSKLELTGTELYLRHATDEESRSGISDPHYLASIRLEAEGGCTYNLTFDGSHNYNAILDNYQSGIGSWSTIDSFSKLDTDEKDPRIILGERCQEDESILLSTKWIDTNLPPKQEFTKTFSVVGYVCNASYNVAEMVVQASLTETSFVVEVDQYEFGKISATNPSNRLNLSSIRNVMLTPEFFEYVPQSKGDDSLGHLADTSSVPFQGATALLSTMYSQNMSAMIQDPDIPRNAARIRRRFFAETLQTTFSASGMTNGEIVSGTKSNLERRIVVSMPVASVICGLTIFSFVLLIIVLLLLRSGHRRLNALHNPTTIAGILSMVQSNHTSLSTFRDMSPYSRRGLKAKLRGHVFVTSPGTLYEIQRNVELCSPGKLQSPRFSWLITC
jgi:hypothetical protein